MKTIAFSRRPRRLPTWAALFLIPLAVHSAVDYRFYGNYLGEHPGEAISGTRVDHLLSAPAFPDGFVDTDRHAAAPGVDTLDGFVTSGWLEWPQNGARPNRIDAGPNTDTGDNYGGALSGILYPPKTGAYRFYVRSDDSSQVYLNVDGPTFIDPKDASVAPIVEEVGCCRSLPEVFSDPIDLVAGEGYAFEVFWKEGSFGDYMELAWSFEGGPIELINAYYLQRDVRYGADDANGITDQTTTDDAPIGFEDRPYPGLGVEFDKAGAATIRWEIHLGSEYETIDETHGFEGFLSPFISAPAARSAWNGRLIRPVVDGTPGDPIVLAIQIDADPPTLNFLTVGTPSGDRLKLISDEPLNIVSALNASNYQLAGRNPDSVVQISNTEFLLDFGELGGAAFDVSVTGLLDQSAAQNIVHGDFRVEFQNPKFEVFLFENLLPRLSGSTKQRLIENLNRLHLDSRFPESPSKRFSLEAGLNIPQVDTIFGPPDRSDFAGYTFGLLNIKEAGDYTFAIRSDDSSAFYLSLDDSFDNLPALDSPTIFESACCDALGAGAPDAVQTVTLAAGRYAFAAYYFEFAFDDYLQVGWRRGPGEAFALIPLSHMMQTLDTGALSFVIAPNSKTLDEGATAIFSAEVTGSPARAIAYQWFKNGAPINGATEPTLRIPNISADMDGNSYELVAYNIDGRHDILRSAPSVLGVRSDDEPPLVESIRLSRHFAKTIEITFDEPMAASTIEDKSNYTLSDGLEIDAATLQADLKTARLTLEDLPPSLSFSLTISGVTDRSITPNLIEPVLFNLESPLFAETFDDVVLGPNVDELLDEEEAWTDTPPDGWSVDDSGVTSLGNPLVGTTEWEGWAFVNADWWYAVGEHDRTLFDKASQVIAVADPSRWHIKGDAGVGDGRFNAWISTPPIAIGSVTDPKLRLTFDSSFIPDGSKTAVIRAQFDDEDPFELLHWESYRSASNFKLPSPNETVELVFLKPPGAESLRLDFGVVNAQVDLWWAIDSLELRPHLERDPPNLNVVGIGTGLGDRVRVRSDEPLDEASAMDPSTYAATGRSIHGVTKISATEYWIDVGPFGGEPFEFSVTDLKDNSRFLNVTSGVFTIDYRNPELQFFYFDNLPVRSFDSDFAALLQNIGRIPALDTFPDNPLQTAPILNSEFLVSHSEIYDSFANELGAYATGWLQIPETGSYTFALRSVNQSAFYLSPNANIENIPPLDEPTLHETLCCGDNVFDGEQGLRMSRIVCEKMQFISAFLQNL